VIAYLLRRTLQAIGVLLGVSMIMFGFLWLLPGGPQRAIAGGLATPGQVTDVRHAYGLGSPVVVQYVKWLGQVLHGNLGFSLVHGQTVSSLLAASLPRTLALTVTATVIAVAAAVPVGLLQAMRRDSAGDRLVRLISYIGYGLPSFLLGAILILLFAVRLRIFGAEGPQAPGIAAVLTDWRDLALPVLTLAVLTFAIFARYVRASALDSLAQDFVRTARAAGSSRRQVLTRHLLRNSLTPVVTLAGLSLPGILGGALVVESLFNIEGMGWQLWQAAQKHDYPVLLGFTLVLGAGTVAGSLLADIGYAIADPRVRYDRR
jgi:peptide/nickel transport system permease protein